MKRARRNGLSEIELRSGEKKNHSVSRPRHRDILFYSPHHIDSIAWLAEHRSFLRSEDVLHASPALYTDEGGYDYNILTIAPLLSEISVQSCVAVKQHKQAILGKVV